MKFCKMRERCCKKKAIINQIKIKRNKRIKRRRKSNQNNRKTQIL